MPAMDSFSLAFRSIFDQFSTVKPTLPPAFFFKIPPSSVPRTLPPPSDHPSFAHPFAISHKTYNFFLKPQIPVTIALVYVTIATYLNTVNGRRKLRPWPFSQTLFFKIMVITHNAILALYSFWTYVGMVNALSRSLYPPWEEHGLAGTIDSLCKVNGPRGYGSAATYNETTSAWGIANHLFHLGADGLQPDSTDVGRIWNEGLAFYGWLFYLSKFYEVIDTFIILAKGRKSSFLQTYHHAGAMLCMWAGIRYMSPPIWMFVLVNSFIHTIMYTFYLCISLHIKVPVWFKKSLTTLQITQFVVGATYAFLHLFVKYRVPISVPYLYRLGSAVSAAPSAASSVLSTAVATVDGAALLKKLLLRAAGREGLAENVLSNNRGQAASFDAVNAVRDFASREQFRYRTDAIWTHCIDTSGQAFAIWLNCVYLLPLTWLFARFFIKAYKKRDERRRSSSTSQTALLSGKDAYKGVTRRLSEAFEDIQHGVEDDGDDIAIVDGAEIEEEIKKVASATKKGMNNALDELKKKTDPLKAKAESESQNVLGMARQTAEKVKASIPSLGGDGAGDANRDGSTTTMAQQTRDILEEKVSSVTKQVRETTSSVVESISQYTSSSTKTEASAREDVTQDQVQEASGKKGTPKATLEESKTSTAESRVPQLTSKESSHRSTNSQEFEDQQSSWIHVKEEAEEAVEKAVEGVKSQVKSLTSSSTPDTNEDADKSQLNKKSDAQLSTSSAETGQTSAKSKAKNKTVKSGGADEPNSNIGSSIQPKVDKSENEPSKLKSDESEDKSAKDEHKQPTFAEVVAETAKPEARTSEATSDSTETTTNAGTGTTEVGKGESAMTEDRTRKSSTVKSSTSTKTKSSSIQSAAKSEKSTTHNSSRTESRATDIINTVKDTAEKAEREAEVGIEKLAETMKSSTKSSNEMGESASESKTQDDSLWFEKLTTGIDSKHSSGPTKKELDKIIDESEPVRDEVIDTADETEAGRNTSSTDKDADENSSSAKRDKDESEDGA